ncbi:MAG: hypothetical protein G01um101438_374 [Parcubacteria group bacterium Gr01-1014_38]|nr:MAG: hypothetical protein G01um101438_374 [Parcubacteria group bacterium Gr01-1014_38]
MNDLVRRNTFVRFAALYAVFSLVILVVSGSLLHRVGRSVREDRGLLARREELSRDFEKLLKDLHETERARRALLLIRPHPEELVSFIRGLERAAARAFIDQNITAFPGIIPVGQGAYPSPIVRYRASLNGPWEKFEAYLRELQQLPHLIRIEAIHMGTTPDGSLLKQGQIEALFAVAVLDPAAPRPGSPGAADVPVSSPSP